MCFTTREEIFSRVKQAAKEVLPDVDVDNIKADTHFRNDLGLDSVDAMSVVIAIEQEFGVSISDVVVKEITTFEQAVIIVEESLREARRTGIGNIMR